MRCLDRRNWHLARRGRLLVVLASFVVIAGCGGPAVSSSASPEGWQTLFDGTRIARLRGYGQVAFPSDRWVVRDGRLRTVPGAPTDLITAESFGNFELEFRWAVATGGNSGVIYRVTESDQPAWTTGPEYQILDDEAHPDGADPTTSAGALYDLIAPTASKRLAAVGADNEGRIVVSDGHVEHWLNGELVVEYEWGGDQVRALIANSKFRDLALFMAADEGHIVFQHHGEEASFSLIRIRRP